MGGRYLVTGVQLGMLKALTGKEWEKLLDEIIYNQFVFNSDSEINLDIKKWLANNIQHPKP